jgi:hypothetical protein
MTGYKHFIELERFKDDCDRLGFRLGYPKHGGHSREFGDIIALSPKDHDALPIFSRDAEMFIGSVEEAIIWLRGIEWARNYDKLLFGDSIIKKRERKEQDYRNEWLVNKLKESN